MKRVHVEFDVDIPVVATDEQENPYNPRIGKT